MKTRKYNFISVGLTGSILISALSLNCLADPRLGASPRGGFRPTNSYFVGPPTYSQHHPRAVQPTLHKKWIADKWEYGTTFTWAELGINLASFATGAALEQYIAKQLASKFVSRCGVKWATSLVNKIKFTVPFLQRIAANDLKKHHGIRIEVCCDIIKSSDCRCQISQDHGVDHGVNPIRNVSYKIYLV